MMEQKRIIPFSPPDITEEEISAVADTLRSGWITTGPKTKEFERKIAEFVGADAAVCLNSATAALELTLMLLGIGKGDEVITSAYTYTASASVICHVGATPVLVDVKKDSFELDLSAVERAITKRTKAIIPVEIGGVPCAYDELFALLSQKRGLFSPNNKIAETIGRVALISDSAHSFGAVYHEQTVGSIADFSCFSFHAVKNLTTGEGGAVTFSATDSKDIDYIYKQYMLMSLHGQTKDALAKTSPGSWEYDIVTTGYKCNMTDIMASIGMVQLSRYKDILKRRRQLIEAYDKGFAGSRIVPLLHFGDRFSSSGHLYITRLNGTDEDYRNNTIKKLAERGISANVHYKPLPMLTAYKLMGFEIADYPNALEVYQNELTLPLHTRLTDDDAEYIIKEYKQLV